MGQFESLLWERRRRGQRHRPTGAPLEPRDPNPLIEWTARPVGRLGRPLIHEVETYLAFFAIARTGAGDRTA